MWRQVLLYFRTHSYHADNCQAKETLQNEDEEDIKAAQWIFKVRQNPGLSKCPGGGGKWCIWKEGRKKVLMLGITALDYLSPRHRYSCNFPFFLSLILCPLFLSVLQPQ